MSYPLSLSTCLPRPLFSFFYQSVKTALFFAVADPGKQFDLVAHHIQTIKRLPGFDASRFIVYVERNLGFEAGEPLVQSVEV